MTDDEVKAYLDRIAYDGPIDRSETTLANLQRLHLQALPFENFNVFVGRPLDLSPGALYHKLITGRRGGYCFELNTLYADLLRYFGFEPRPILARVRVREPEDTPPRTHLAHLVEVEGGATYLTDVGFGGLNTHVPLCIDQCGEIDDGAGLVRLVPYGDTEYIIERKTDDDWKPVYSFDTVEVHPSDLILSNHYTETHPDSIFRHGRFLSLFTDEGRIGLYENQFTERVGPEVITRQEVANGPSWKQFVEERFGIALDLSDDEIETLSNPPTEPVG